MSDPPIEHWRGQRVVDLGDIRVAQGQSRRPHNICPHRNLVYDRRERRIWCEDCEHTIEPFDAFMLMIDQHHNATQKADRLLREAHEARDKQIHRIAARDMEKLWRKKMAPCCPHCQRGLLPEDLEGRRMAVGRHYEIARRKRDQKP